MPSPHEGQPVLAAGAELSAARAAMILLHGRGADAQSILQLAREIDVHDTAFLAPQAAGRTWYPHSFLAPRERNEPYLSSALAAVEGVLGRLRAVGVAEERIMILGFSQGACLAAEFAARHATQLGAVFILTGGLIGDAIAARAEYTGSFGGCPILLASGDPDPHVPWARVEESAALFRDMDADVEVVRYPGRPHTVTEDELSRVRRRARDVAAWRAVRKSAPPTPGQ